MKQIISSGQPNNSMMTFPRRHNDETAFNYIFYGDIEPGDQIIHFGETFHVKEVVAKNVAAGKWNDKAPFYYTLKAAFSIEEYEAAKKMREQHINRESKFLNRK